MNISKAVFRQLQFLSQFLCSLLGEENPVVTVTHKKIQSLPKIAKSELYLGSEDNPNDKTNINASYF